MINKFLTSPDYNLVHDQVRSLTLKKVNNKIDQETTQLIEDLKAINDEELIQLRLEELAKEWDIDRAVMAIFSVLVFSQLLIGRKNPKWITFPLIQTAFLFTHSTLGWCPPVLALRPLGFRTKKEIQREREALLKLLKK